MEKIEKLDKRIRQLLRKSYSGSRFEWKKTGEMTLVDIIIASKQTEMILDFKNSHIIIEGDSQYWDLNEMLHLQKEPLIDMLLKHFGESEDGLYHKYSIEKKEGQMEPEAEYFVLRFDKDANPLYRDSSIKALKVFIKEMEKVNLKLAKDLGGRITWADMKIKDIK